jgi:hypothetical protein
LAQSSIALYGKPGFEFQGRSWIYPSLTTPLRACCYPKRILGTIRGRRGAAGARELLDDALALAEGMGEPHWVAQARAVRAELLWLSGRDGLAVKEARAAYKASRSRLEQPAAQFRYLCQPSWAFLPITRPAWPPYGRGDSSDDRRRRSVPLFMDVHQIAGGVAMDDVAQAHLADLQAQAAHDVRYLRY